MGGGLVELSVAALLLVGSHFLLSSAPIRGRLAGALGERGFLGLYSALALVLFIWLIWSYGDAPVVPLWSPPEGTAWLAILVMPLALLLLVGGYSQRNPTAVMQEKAAGERPAPGILAITRHPVMWAIGLWALVHLASNGDAASAILFGALAVLALAGTVVIDSKKRRSWGADWARFAAVTSNIPFAAILAGRARFHPAEMGWTRLAAAIGLYAALLALHPVVIGVPALPV
ncbi:NnrU family protein [Rhodospirillaceae bacterium SYSU D60014]|uniref:NnrU family protein n=1 Tax=Virgifigura deserti TaxID=2268457 RepID=UPI000E6665FA